MYDLYLYLFYFSRMQKMGWNRCLRIATALGRSAPASTASATTGRSAALARTRSMRLRTTASAIHRILQRSALGVGLRVVDLESHLLEQGSHYRATARTNVLLDIGKADWAVTHCLLGRMRMSMAVGVVSMPVAMFRSHAHTDAHIDPATGSSGSAGSNAHSSGSAHICIGIGIRLLLVRSVELLLFLFGYLLDRHKSLFSHLNSFCHVADRGVFY